MTQGARIQRVGALTDFKSALRDFEQDARASLVSIDLEIRRALDWVLHEQPEHWQRQLRKCGDAVVQAKADLSRCRNVPTPGGGVPSCLDQKKALDKAQLRLREAEDKVRAVRHWGVVVQHEVTEYHGRINQLVLLLDADLPQAMVAIERMLAALESYLSLGSGAALPTPAATFSAGEGPAAPGAADSESRSEQPAAVSPPPVQELGMPGPSERI